MSKRTSLHDENLKARVIELTDSLIVPIGDVIPNEETPEGTAVIRVK